MVFKVGQRWISTTESQLGLGMITEVSARQVNISFPAAGEERMYSVDSAPLSRIIYKIGEDILTNDEQSFTIQAVKEHNGLVFYEVVAKNGDLQQISEVSLSCFISLNAPQQRLLSGLLDKIQTYRLRVDTLNHLSRLQQSPVRGLLGARTNHLPHQIYIAHEVAQRFAPRVLLADEVGLGKTIEAGMILHYQLHTGRANRVLIVVPQTLIHQWLVEMIRRFNLHFSIIDESRYQDLQDEQDLADDDDIERDSLNEGNPFASESRVLCSLEFLQRHPQGQEHALTCDWDLLIVDEAHHLHWSEDKPSAEYQLVEELSMHSKGLLLLTATPEQAGVASHFARLRLLDPARYPSLLQFQEEEQQYREINELVQFLLELEPMQTLETLPARILQQLSSYLHNDPASLSAQEAITALLDRHGTGRVLFRNTRAAIKGFPKRQLYPYALPCPELYVQHLATSLAQELFPETRLNPKALWAGNDPRVAWLVTLCHELGKEKILVICAQTDTVKAVEYHLKNKEGIRSTAFHEGLTIIERDRAAAYFAEEEEGAQVMVCSEIGSEGRNFQFAHHLVLFDLPLNPDLLEQRIGRLDRIGQTQDIQIHVPYLQATAQETLFRWYHEGLNAFQISNASGFSIYETFAESLSALLTEPNEQQLDALIQKTQQRVAEIAQAQEQGRDRLLELNSCNLPYAQSLITVMETEEQCIELQNYMAAVFQEYGIDHDYHSEATEVLYPTEHMKTTHFPYLKEDGMTVTYSRPKALHREDIDFLSWEHPMVSESMEMILDSEVGNATLATISLKNIPAGTLFLEAFYTPNTAAPKQLQLDRFLPITPIRFFIDATGKNLTHILDYERLNSLCQAVKRQLGYPIISQIHAELEFMIKKSKALAEHELVPLMEHAKKQLQEQMSGEIQRLEALQNVNPAIREEEIVFFREQLGQGLTYLDSVQLKLQALRVIINKH